MQTFLLLSVTFATLVTALFLYVDNCLLLFQHPITRWIARNVYRSLEESYETGMAVVYRENEKRQLR